MLSKITIVGAGTGGLCLAQGLKQSCEFGIDANGSPYCKSSSLAEASQALFNRQGSPYRITEGLPVIRSGSSVFCQSVLFQDQTDVHQRRHRVWYLGDVWEVGGWKTNFSQCSAANSPTSCLEQFSCSSDWQLAPLLPSVGGAAYVSLSG